MQTVFSRNLREAVLVIILLRSRTISSNRSINSGITNPLMPTKRGTKIRVLLLKIHSGRTKTPPTLLTPGGQFSQLLKTPNGPSLSTKTGHNHSKTKFNTLRTLPISGTSLKFSTNGPTKSSSLQATITTKKLSLLSTKKALQGHHQLTRQAIL